MVQQSVDLYLSVLCLIFKALDFIFLVKSPAAFITIFQSFNLYQQRCSGRNKVKTSRKKMFLKSKGLNYQGGNNAQIIRECGIQEKNLCMSQQHFQCAYIWKAFNKIMRNLSLFLVCALLGAVAFGQMTLNLNGATYEVTSGFYSLSVPVSGGVPPLTYNFQAFPTTWVQVGSKLNIPVIETIPGGTWALKVIVTDSLNNKLKRSLIVKISNGGDPLLGDYSYDQTFSFSSTGQVTSIPTTTAMISESSGSSSGSSSSSSSTYSSSSSSSSSGSSGLGVSFGSTSSTTGIVTLQSSGTGVNTALPSSSQLDILINGGDVVAIKLIIQKVIASTLSCPGKSQYLMDFLGRIQSFIAIKGSQVTQLSNIVANSKTQIAALTVQIANYTLAIEQLGISGLQTELESVLNNLQIAYNAYNAQNVDLTPYNLNITANLQSISNLTSQRNSTSAQLALDQGALKDTETLIASLESQLAAAKGNKQTLSARILQETSGVVSLTARIDSLNSQNVALNNDINAINNNKATLMANYQSIETRAEGIRNTIKAYTSQKDKYTSQIDTLKAQTLQINGNLDISPIITLNSTIVSLKNSIPSLQQQINHVKFNCLGVVNYTVQTLNGTVKYVFGSSLFSTYVTQQYGQTNTNAAQALLGPISQVSLTPVTIFNDQWSQTFGSAFQKDLALIQASDKTPNFLVSDFSCSSSVALISGNGVVSRISANVVYATIAGGSTAILILGACSNVLVMEGQVPKIGSNIFWNGLKISSDTYQTYSALFV